MSSCNLISFQCLVVESVSLDDKCNETCRTNVKTHSGVVKMVDTNGIDFQG